MGVYRLICKGVRTTGNKVCAQGAIIATEIAIWQRNWNLIDM